MQQNNVQGQTKNWSVLPVKNKIGAAVQGVI
jgi:hypothetical protein